MQGICGCSAIIFRFYSLEFITLADATVVSFSSPVLVAVLAHIFLGEKCGVVSIVVAVLAALGVVVIARPPLLTNAIFDTSDDAKVTIFFSQDKNSIYIKYSALMIGRSSLKKLDTKI